MVVKIREMKWGDLDDMFRCDEELHRELKSHITMSVGDYKKKPNMPDYIYYFSHLYKDMLEKKAVAYVLEVDGRVVGVAEITDAKVPDGNSVGELGVAIVKAHRNKGLGLKLVKATLKAARGKFKIITLGTFAENRPAVAFFKKAGFKEYGTGIGFVKRGKMLMSQKYMYMRL
ncbi:MAG: GNAT family N-acetyltransferase [Candidatus Micrarchaeota archaeon]|nr:GNAT family N-acetyltransferase [Candidatus Micrarchaeota archaeon]